MSLWVTISDRVYAFKCNNSSVHTSPNLQGKLHQPDCNLTFNFTLSLWRSSTSLSSYVMWSWSVRYVCVEEQPSHLGNIWQKARVPPPLLNAVSDRAAANSCLLSRGAKRVTLWEWFMTSKLISTCWPGQLTSNCGHATKEEADCSKDLFVNSLWDSFTNTSFSHHYDVCDYVQFEHNLHA